MDTIRLIDIAQALGKLYQDKNSATLKQWQIDKDLLARQIAMTPAEGWSGKNEEQRKQAQALAFAEDKAVQAMQADLHTIRGQLLTIATGIQTLEDERRAIEWTIKAQMVYALSNAGVSRSTGAVEETAFGDVQEAQADQALFEAAPVEEPVVEIPF